MDSKALLVQALMSLLVPSMILAPFYVKQQRAKIAAEARAADAGASESGAKADVLLSTDERAWLAAAKQDALDARREAAEARAEARNCRQQNVRLWARLDATDRHMLALERAMRDARIEVPTRPLELQKPLT